MERDNTGSQGIGEAKCADPNVCTLAERFQESVRLTRFITRLVTEALALEADQISFSLSGETIVISLQRNGVERKSLSIAANWFDPISSWFQERRSPFALSDASASGEHKTRDIFQAAMRIGEQVICAWYERRVDFNKKTVINLSKVERYRLPRWIEQFQISATQRKSFDSMLEADCGVILVSGPSQERLRQAIAGVLTTSNFVYAGQLSPALIEDVLTKYSKTNPVVIGTLSEDSVDAVLKLRAAGFNFAEHTFLGSLCQGFVKAVCRHCARKSVPDRKMIEVLPGQLQVGADSGYMVGRGCESCGQSGYRGVVGVQSLVIGDTEIIRKLRDGAQEEELLESAYARGTRALLEDGVRKVREGIISFEALYDLCQVIRPAYLKHLRRAGGASAEERIPITDDYFKASEGIAKSQPMRGKAVFAGDSARAQDSEPLFSLGPSGKIREKPLLLVVEDDPDQREILSMVLKSAQYDVKLVGDGVEAITFLDEELPDLIISDLMMPRMDGTELLAKLKSHQIYKKIPVLILTVIVDTDKEFTLLNLGADDYCEKSIQRKILLKRIENLLKRTK